MSVWKLTFLLWFIRIVKPDWILAYYVPGTGFIRTISTLLLYLLFLYMVFSKKKPIIDKTYFLYFLAILVATLFSQNTGRSYNIVLRPMIDSLLFYSIMITIIKDEKQLDSMFNLYLGSLVFFSLCGIVFKGKVPFSIILDNEDSFGPFMVLGIPFAFYTAFRYEKVRYRNILVSLLCVAGVVASYARGAFVSTCVVAMYIWIKFKNKVVITMALLGIGLFVVIAAAVLFEGGFYWKEMSTISGEDEGREFLWTKATNMFLAYPVTGVGPANFGFMLPKFATRDELNKRGVTMSQIYGRVVHNIYFQMLAEVGFLGIFCFAMVVFAFWRKNRTIRQCYEKWVKHRDKNEDRAEQIPNSFRKNYYYSIAVFGAMIGYLMNGLFYDLLWYHWFPDLLILNSLIYQSCERLDVEMKNQGTVAMERVEVEKGWRVDTERPLHSR